ncbi:MAG TPA: HAMP domain-containing sensor histidine kinase [Symbiobacteriaceae bacterium]|nr:HAMP domain-containing sensor histidine kinase [Symbiobacteriaceae bacterium]
MGADDVESFSELLGRIESLDCEWASMFLDSLRTQIDAEYLAFFAGDRENDTVLFLRGSAGPLPAEYREAGGLHFNWRKAGLVDYSLADRALLDWREVTDLDQPRLLKGFRGVGVRAAAQARLVPAHFPGGPFGLLAVGGSGTHLQGGEEEGRTRAICRDWALRLLSAHAVGLLRTERVDWDKTNRMTGHRLRSLVQTIRSQLYYIQAAETADLGELGPEDAAKALEVLNQSLRRLAELSYGAESSMPDVRVVQRRPVPLGEIIWEAVASQESIARAQNVEIAVSPEIDALPLVWGNPTLLGYAFVNLINNGLKYSFPPPVDKRRVLRIHPAMARPNPGEVRVEVVNFGLGIKEQDLERIFDWGVRLSPGSSRFKETYGKGIGLWECRHIIQGHGGQIWAKSIGYDASPVTDQNINRCITVFTLALPAALDETQRGD